MSDRIVVPVEMRGAALKAVAEKHGVTSIGGMAACWADDANCAVEAALLWQDEKLISLGKRLEASPGWGIKAYESVEAVRRMYVVPEPKMVDFENVNRHIFSQDGRIGSGPMVSASDYDTLLGEYRRALKISAQKIQSGYDG